MTEYVKVSKKSLDELKEARDTLYEVLEHYCPEQMGDINFISHLTQCTSKIYNVTHRKWEEV